MAEKAKWVPAVAVLGIIMGAFGIFGGLQHIAMPQIMKWQKEFMPQWMDSMNKSMDEERAVVNERLKKAGVTFTAKNMENFSDNYKKMMDKFMNFPPWYGTFSYITGGIGVIIGAFYLYASILLLQWKAAGLKMFFIVIIAAIIFVAARGIGTAMAMPSMFAISALVGSLFSLIINIILLSVAAGGSREGFK